MTAAATETTGQIEGTADAGNCGIVPRVVFSIDKPKLHNTGYGDFSGIPRCHIPGLSALLPNNGGAIAQGHVLCVFRDGGQFLTYAADVLGADVYDLS